MRALLRALALAAVLLACAFAARAGSVTVFAAASLKESLDAVARDFEAASGHRVAISYAGSNVLARQITNGAPADVFIAADAVWVDYVEARGLAVAGSRRDLLGNELALVAPAASALRLALTPGVDVARALGRGRIALANPDAVPAGRYAKAAFVALGAWQAIEPRVAATDNVRGALALVARGEAPLGVVYRTDALAEPKVRVVATFPATTHPQIVYPVLLLRRAREPQATQLLAFLSSPAARAVFERFGFRVP